MPTPRDGNPLLRYLRLEPGEGGLTFTLALLMATLFGGYTVAKVLRDSMFISEFGAKNLPWGYVAVAVASIAVVALESRMTERLARSGATALGQTIAIACSIAFAGLYVFNHRWVALGFYIWAGSQALMLLSYFWLLALELWDSRRAQVILPLFSGAGLVGGVLGGAFANWAVNRVGISGLLWTLAGLLVVVRAITALLDRQLPVRRSWRRPGPARRRSRSFAIRRSSAICGDPRPLGRGVDAGRFPVQVRGPAALPAATR
jgi:ATP/ADP translocase